MPGDGSGGAGYWCWWPLCSGCGADRVLRVLGPVAAAMLVTVAVLTLAGARLSLIHLVALQLVAGVGLDYALFFARRPLDAEERSRTLRTLVTCNAMTLLTFGMLAACQTPLLRDIGMTVALGGMGMGFEFLFAGERPHGLARAGFEREVWLRSRLRPLVLTASTAISAIGRGAAAHVHALRTRAAVCGRTISNRPPAAGSAGSTKSRRIACPLHCRRSTAATTGWRTWRCTPMDLPTRGRGP